MNLIPKANWMVSIFLFTRNTHRYTFYPHIINSINDLERLWLKEYYRDRFLYLKCDLYFMFACTHVLFTSISHNAHIVLMMSSTWNVKQVSLTWTTEARTIHNQIDCFRYVIQSYNIIPLDSVVLMCVCRSFKLKLSTRSTVDTFIGYG